MRPVTFGACLALSCTAVAWPCCMLPLEHPGRISQRSHDGVIVHADGREELILRINYRIEGDRPEQFAWVITVPHEPDAYRIADARLFDDMNSLAMKLLVPKPRRQPSQGRFTASAAAAGLEFGERVQVGPYDIQPVRAVGREALTGLNAWLTDNGFPTEDPEHMAYFVDQGFTFLCTRISPTEGEEKVGPGGLLPPLHLSFATEKPYYPLRFSSRQGVFDVNLHVLTKTPFDFEASSDALDRVNYSSLISAHPGGRPGGSRSVTMRKNMTVPYDVLPETLRDTLGETRFDDDRSPWIFNNLIGRDVNTDNAIARWAEDIFFATKER